MLRHTLYTAIVLITAGLAGWLAVHFLTAWFELPPDMTLCSTVLGNHTYTVENPAEFSACIKENAEVFIKYDFAETKDLSKAFLTLLTAVFVASVTFSEKIVGIGNAGWWAKFLMVLCWFLLLTAIIACGIALAFMTMALGWAAHEPTRAYWVFENYAGWLFIVAGICFGSGLAAMLITGIISLLHPVKQMN